MGLMKVYCRVYQYVFASFNEKINNREPQVMYGESAIMDITEVLKNNKIKKPMVVTGPRISKSEHFIKFASTLEQGFVLFDKVKPDPPVSMIEEMVALYRAQKCDGIIAIGGGSNIDAAKAMGARIARPRKSLAKLGGVLKVCKKTPFLIAVPTTAGTGSECTIAAVVTDDSIGRKYAINDPVLCPDVAVLDPVMSVSLPPNLTAYTGMDALTHAVEAYLNKGYHRSNTETLVIESVRAIFEYLPLAYENGNDVQAREQMLLASYKAGIAFSTACVGNVHAIAHTVGGKYHVQHGLANAIILPHVLRAYLPKSEKELAKLSKAVELSDKDTDNQTAALEFIEKIEEMNRAFSIPDYIAEIQESDIEEMATWANREANPLYPVPVIFNKHKFAELLRELCK